VSVLGWFDLVYCHTDIPFNLSIRRWYISISIRSNLSSSSRSKKTTTSS